MWVDKLLYFLLFLRIYCGLDDGSLAVWTIPEGGLVAPVNTPDTRVRGLEAENICNTKKYLVAGAGTRRQVHDREVPPAGGGRGGERGPGPPGQGEL